MTLHTFTDSALVSSLEALDDALAAYRNRLQAPRVKALLGQVTNRADSVRKTRKKDLTITVRGMVLTMTHEVVLTLPNTAVLNLSTIRSIQVKEQAEKVAERQKLRREEVSAKRKALA